MTDIVNKLWGMCHTLRHDGIDYGDYIEQLTYLLFIKMADEKSVALPAGCDWDSLKPKFLDVKSYNILNFDKLQGIYVFCTHVKYIKLLVLFGFW